MSYWVYFEWHLESRASRHRVIAPNPDEAIDRFYVEMEILGWGDQRQKCRIIRVEPLF
jgi:hypothetical protein